MIGSVNTGGGGGKKIIAVVNVVNAGANATVTLADGSKVFTGNADTLGACTINVDKTGEYTMMSSVRGQTKTISIQATGNYSMDFFTTLYNVGNQCSEITGGWEDYAYKVSGSTAAGEFYLQPEKMAVNGSVNVTQRSYGGRTKANVSLAGYSSLCLEMNSNNVNDNMFYYGIISESSDDIVTQSLQYGSQGGSTSKILLRIPISANGSYRVAVVAKRNNNNCIFYVHKIWLE